MISANAMTLSAVARKLPGRNGHASVAAVSRWLSHGVELPNGDRVFLTAVRVGQHVFITPEALERFIISMNPERPATEKANRTPTERSRAAESACRQLELMGA